MSGPLLSGLDDLADRLDAAAPPAPVVVGFDGFVDEMITVVGERRADGTWTPMPGIAGFAAWAAAAAGRSSLREIVVHRQDPGGCAINVGDGLAALGVAVDCFATLGAPVHPAFAAITKRFRSTTSWGSSHGRTLALEFSDGKLMLSAVEQLSELDPALLAAATADGAFRRALEQAGMLIMTNWSLYRHMTPVWRALQAGALRALPNRPRVFLDLVDPAGRSPAELHEALEVARGFAIAGPVTLGVNLNEANQIARLMELAPGIDDAASLSSVARALRDALGLDEIVIHALHHAATADASGVAVRTGPWCRDPKKLTGAGDRFNAGYALGHLLSLPPGDRLLLGNAASGSYVRNASSATRQELAAFMRLWAAGSV